MQNRFVKLIAVLLKYPKITLGLFFALTLFFSYYALKLPIDANANSFILEDDKDLQTFNAINKDYQARDFLMLSYSPKADIFSKSSLQTLQNITQDLLKIQEIESTFSILNAPLLKSIPNLSWQENLKLNPNLLSKEVDIHLAKQEILNHPFYRQNIISKDGKTAGIMIFLKEDSKLASLKAQKKASTNTQEIKALTNAIKQHTKSIQQKNKITLDKIKALSDKYNNSLSLGGIMMIASDMVTYVKADLKTYGITLTLLLALALFFFFRSLRFIFIPLVICLSTLIISSGIFAFLGYEITVVSSNFVSLLLIISISLTIHLITTYLEFLEKFPKTSQKNLLLATLLSKASPSFFAIFTTIIGFLSLIFAEIEPIIKLGIVMSIGVSVALLVAYILFACILILLPKQKKVLPLPKWHKTFLFSCANFAIHQKKIVYLISAFCVIFSIYGITQLKVENSFVNYFKDSSDIKQGLLVIDKELGGTMMLDILATFEDKEQSKNTDSSLLDFEEEFNALEQQESYWFDAKKLRVAKEIHNFLAQNAYIGSILSLHSVSMLIDSLGIGADNFTIPFLYQNAQASIKEKLFSPYIHIDKNQMRFTIRVFDSNPTLQRDFFIKELNKDLQEIAQKEEIKIEVNGVMVLYNNLLQSLISSQVDTLLLVILAISLTFLVIFKDLKLTLIAILTNIIPLSLVFGILGAFHIPLDLMGVTIAAISLGIGVDGVIHYIHRYKEEIKKKPLFSAIRISHLNIGTAMYYTTLSICLGFSMMMSSSFIPTIYFGFLTTLVMLFMLASALFLLPALILAFNCKK